MTPILQEKIEWRLYLVHAFFCALSFVVVWFTFPETKGLALEEMDTLFGDQSVSPTPRGVESQSIAEGSEYPGEDPAEPPSEEQLQRYLAKGISAAGLFDKLRGLKANDQQAYSRLDDP